MVGNEHGVACLVIACLVNFVVVALVFWFCKTKKFSKALKTNQQHESCLGWASFRWSDSFTRARLEHWYLPRPSEEDKGYIGMSDSVACTSPRPSHARRMCERQIGFLGA
jgi:hypothetical protein